MEEQRPADSLEGNSWPLPIGELANVGDKTGQTKTPSTKRTLLGALTGSVGGLFLGVVLPNAVAFEYGRTHDGLPGLTAGLYLYLIPLLIDLCLAILLLRRQKAVGVVFGIVSIAVSIAISCLLSILPPFPPD